MDLHAQAEELGIETGFHDGRGRWHDIDSAALAQVLAAMPQPLQRRLLCAPVVIRQGAAARTELMPAATLPVRWEILSDGVVLARGVARERVVAWPRHLPGGVHRLLLREQATSHREEVPLIVAPAAHQGPPRRAWLLAVQLYGLRSPRNWGIGDFADLGRLIEVAAGWGAAGIGLNPLHVLFGERPGDCSPYSPNSRLFLNPLYIAMDDLPGGAVSLDEADAQLLARARHGELVDHVAVAALKWRALRAAFTRFCAAPVAAERAAFDAFRAERGSILRRFACFEVLRGRFGSPWWDWPDEWCAPDDATCDAFGAGKQADEVAFVAFVQWIADRQLAACQARALECGMSVGLYLDIAVGVRADGFDAWNEQQAIPRHLSVGAPPDGLNTAGQDWGLAGFNGTGLQARGFAPFRAVLRAAMRHAGAVRIDHVMGLKRLYLVPRGFDARNGAYVPMPFQAMLAITALESAAHRCIVVGEDLGTVPEGFREDAAEWGIWSYRVMMFARDPHGGFLASEHYPDDALVTFSTHDLATFAGWRRGGDLSLKRSLGMDPGEGDDARAHAVHLLRDVLRRHAIDRDDLYAVLAFLARTRSRLLAVALDDLLGVEDQPNIPGTVNEHPNWRRRLAVQIDEVPTAIDLAALRAALAPRSEGDPVADQHARG